MNPAQKRFSPKRVASNKQFPISFPVSSIRIAAALIMVLAQSGALTPTAHAASTEAVADTLTTPVNRNLVFPAWMLVTNDIAGSANGSNTHLTVVDASATTTAGGTVNWGTVSWTNRYDGLASTVLVDEAKAVAVDPSGNVYVTGNSYANSTYQDYATIKFSSVGEPLWTNRYHGPFGTYDYAHALAVHSNGNAVVTGRSAGSLGFSDYATLKYAPDGQALWTNRYDGPGAKHDYPTAVAVASNGSVYVSGYSAGTNGYNDYTTIKYSSGGELLWTCRYDGPAGLEDFARAMGLDSAGNAYVTGYAYDTATSADFVTIKYSSDGQPLWTNRYTSPGFSSDTAYALAVDSGGNVYVAGCGPFDYLTVKYSSAGECLWTNMYNGPGNHVDVARAVAVDGSGNIYVTGSSFGLGTTDDYATLKYSSAGQPLWTNRYNGPGGSADIAYALAVDGCGNVQVSGSSTGSGSGTDYATVVYSSGGQPLGTNRYNGPGNSSDIAYALAVDPSGNAFVTGSSTGSASGTDYATIRHGVPVFTYQPPTNYSGIDTFNYVIRDSLGEQVTGQVSVEVTNLPALRPQFATFGWVSNGMQFELSGESGHAIEIHISTDLVNWTLLTTLTNQIGTLPYTDPQATNCPIRFYKAIQVP